MVACCPLQECDETATVYNVDKRRGRKDHACCECDDVIARGDLHEYISMLFDGAWSSFRLCLLCSEIGNHFACGGRVLETLWSDLEDNFFPDMRMGGPCMEGLSPAAKLKLVERRMAWYLDQDEINDSAWADWPKHRDRQAPLVAKVVREEAVPWMETPEYFWMQRFEIEAALRDYDAGKQQGEP